MRGSLCTFFCMLVVSVALPQDQHVVIGFWNVENLFDTVDDPMKNDDEFTPRGKNGWTSERYKKKLERLSSVIAGLGSPEARNGPAVIGMCEVENGAALDDLLRTPALSRTGYRAVHHEGPDERGIDVCLIYDPKRFVVDRTVSCRVLLPDEKKKTRDILLADGVLAGERMAILVNHWPSRRGGEKATRSLRLAAAQVLRRICDSLFLADSTRAIIVMGDFNDDPSAASVKNTLRTGDDPEKVPATNFYNPMAALFRRGVGSIAWNDRWNLFDQILLSPHLCDGKGLSYRKAAVCNESFMRAEEGNFKGYPFRTFSGGVYTGGYSDHFPVVVFLSKKR